MGRPVALLDVDNTLIFGTDTNTLNVTLLNSLKSNGIVDIYLFTDMTFKAHSIQERNEIIANITFMGFTVHGVMTPSDLTWDSVPEVEARRLHNFCVVEGRYTGSYADPAFNDFILRSSADLPEVAAGALRYQPDKTPGKAYAEAASYFSTHDSTLSEDIVLRSQFSKACSDNLIRNMQQYRHTKGLMLDLFLQKMPQWVSSIVVADDNQQVIDSIEGFKPVVNTTKVPPVTVVPVTNQNLDTAYYNQKLEQHYEKVIKVELSYLKVTSTHISDANTIKKINALISKVESLRGKEKASDLAKVLVHTSSMLAGTCLQQRKESKEEFSIRTDIEPMDLTTYKKEAEKYSGHPNKGLKTLGKIMLGLAVAVGIILVVLVSVGTMGIGAAPAIGLMATAGVSLAASFGFFTFGRQKGLSKAMVELADNFVKKEDAVKPSLASASV